MSVPPPWVFVLLALAAFRVFRLLARDTITEPVRDALSYPDAEAVTLDKPRHEWARDPDLERLFRERGKPLRVYAATLIRCPWCLGFYAAAGWWGAWLLTPAWTTFAAAPFALAAVVALVEKNLDA